ncbi:MAG: hypothetical protein QOJ79_2259 [Actinomycetota bacterium]|nr:hypothetical protein [Actinomycetota bacterium]
MEHSIRTRRRLIAVLPATAAALLAIGNATLPKHTFVFTGTTEHALGALAATGAAPGRVRLAGLVLIVGYTCLAAAFCALASLVTRRGGSAATAGAVFGVVGSAGAVMVTCWIALSVYAANAADIASEAKAGYLVSLVKTSGLGNAAGLPFLGGLFLGGVLMGFGLFRSGAVPRWLAVLFPITLIPATLAAPQDVLGGLLALPLVAVMTRLSWELLRAANDVVPEAVDAPAIAAVTASV